MKKKSVRFTSEKSAKSFAKEVNGEIRDLRSYESRKSDFKVVYGSGDRRESDFSSDMNLNETDWHIAEDL